MAFAAKVVLLVAGNLLSSLASRPVYFWHKEDWLYYGTLFRSHSFSLLTCLEDGVARQYLRTVFTIIPEFCWLYAFSTLALDITSVLRVQNQRPRITLIDLGPQFTGTLRSLQHAAHQRLQIFLVFIFRFFGGLMYICCSRDLTPV